MFITSSIKELTMTVTRNQLMNEVMTNLEEAGFELSSQCDVRPSCFDLVARRGERLILVKVLSNIDSLTKEDAVALQQVAFFFNATALVVGEKARRGVLEEGTVYKRYGVYTVTPPSFNSVTADGESPREFVQRGGRFVAIDGAKLREARTYRKMTKEQLAECVEVSTRAILAYEKEEMDVSSDVAERLEKVLETDLTIPIDILRKPVGRKHLDRPRLPKDIPDIEKRVNEFFERLGMKVLWTDRAPFHVAAKEPGPPLLTGIGSLKSLTLHKRVEILKSVSKVAESSAMIVVEEGKAEKQVSELPVIKQLELDGIDKPSELMKIIEERSGT
jgi:putative transcriptional regulator